MSDIKDYLVKRIDENLEEISASVNLLRDSAELFRDYYQSEYARYYHVSTITRQRDQSPLEDIYLPLTISDNSGNGYTIDSYPKELFLKNKNILIEDQGGKGKTTILKWIFFETFNKGRYIPLFVELRRISKYDSVIDYIHDKVNTSNSNISMRLIKKTNQFW